MDSQTVRHSGIVKELKDGKATVSIVSKASCISCSLNSVCQASDVKEKEVEVELYSAASVQKGDKVTLELKQSYGNWAVALGYFFPFLVLFGGLIAFLQTGMDQGLAGILSLALLVPYYGTLYLLRDFFKKRFRTKIVDT